MVSRYPSPIAAHLHEPRRARIGDVLPFEKHAARKAAAGQRRGVRIGRALDAGDAAHALENLALPLHRGLERHALAS